MQLGGKGAYTAIDAVSGEMTKQLAFALRDGGTVLVYGALSNDPVQMDTLDTLYKFKRVEVRHSSFPWLCLTALKVWCTDARQSGDVQWLLCVKAVLHGVALAGQLKGLMVSYHQTQSAMTACSHC